MQPRQLGERALTLLRRGWSVLPEPITTSRLAVSTRRAVITQLTGEPPPTERVIRTPAELDEMIELLEEAGRISDDELRKGFRSFRMELDFHPPPDPFSERYRQAVLELYAWLHGAPYELSNELTAFDLEQATTQPFPYLTHSCSTVGDYTIAVGHLIRTLNLDPGSRVLELGAGWGTLTVALAQMGLSVVALDVCPQFTALINARAARVGVEITAITGDFSAIESMEEGLFDAVIFFESFHHCSDHLSLIAALDRVVAPGGKVLFAAEPIAARFWTPWGLRLDGESLWAIRRNGWLELGFQRAYFEEALHRYGWTVERTNCAETHWGEIFVARRSPR